ncbi:unnamed protein product [Camellia sinensis]
MTLARPRLRTNRKAKNTRQSTNTFGSKLIDISSSIQNGQIETISGVIFVTVDCNELVLNSKPSGNTGVAGGEIGEIGTTSGVEGSGGAELGNPVMGCFDRGTDVGGDEELEWIETERGEIGGKGEGIELGLEVGEARERSREVWELKQRGFFEVLREGDFVKSEEGLATLGFVVGVVDWHFWVVVSAIRDWPRDSRNIA